MADWFEPKRFGYGAGKPISWQGWAVTIAYLGLVLIAALLIVRSMLVFLAILLPATLAFIIISARTTRGGWRWRWGKKDL
jgi:hypothetical protein